ncbi:MAG: carboxypeptidase-like regulatory domain-containing protein [Gemmatimonadota bacterium]
MTAMISLQSPPSFNFAFFCWTILWMTAACVSREVTDRQSKSPTTGTISGRVIDDIGNPLVGSQALLLNMDGTPTNRGNVANDQGKFTMNSIAPGDWYVLASFPVCHLPDTTRVRVEPGRETDVTFHLEWSYEHHCPCEPGVDRSRLRNLVDTAWVCD